jgi:UDP-N-acetylglucosamine--N-acetylmuramyl-(pentapeptide) pyrophosphoryl-undecaprenol N-acetylglucosamine transferase
VTTVLVAANGGHLAQLVDLAPRLGRLADDVVWVTQRSPQSDSLLGDAPRVDAPPVRERDVAAVARLNRLAARVFRATRATAVVSTGSGIALGFLPQAVAWGMAAHYVESATFVDGPSLTGRVLERVPGVQLYTQHPAWATGRWSYRGSVFDGFTVAPQSRPASLRRVVVTLGSDRWTFRPLIDRLLELLPDDADILWQTGPTPVHDLPIRAVPYLPAEQLAAAIGRADLVVSHAGCGTTLTALRAGRRPVLVPRDPTRGEVIDDHQRIFARSLAESGLVVAREVDQLRLADLQEAAASEVRRSAAPPPIELGRRKPPVTHHRVITGRFRRGRPSIPSC